MASVRLFGRQAGGPAIYQPAENDFAGLLEQSGHGWFWATDRDGLITYVSPHLALEFVDSADGLNGTPFADLFLPTTANTPARERIGFVLSREGSFDKLTVQSAQVANRRWWEVTGRARRDAGGEFAGHEGFCVDVTERRATSESASKLALYDALTGLPNRLNMTQYMAAQCVLGRDCAVMLIDLDRFKAVNDSLGHPAGDALLKQVSARILKIVGDRDKVFRLGGDEFKLVLPGRSDREGLGAMAAQLIESVSQPYVIDGSRCVIGASIGIATSPADGQGGDEITRKADLALYSAKSHGRGCHRYFTDDLLKEAEDRRQLEEDLRDALARNELSLRYQPLVCTQTESVTGVEALLRWDHPTKGPISPAVFIPMAEEADLIEMLGEWTIRRACEEAATWPQPIRVAVNVSPIQFANPQFPSLVTSALARSGLDPSRFELELTEGIFLENGVETDAMFAQLKGLGVRLVLDDFGTGYSSFGYLRTAPFDKIKIDQSFVRGATEPGSRNAAIIAAIVALAHALDMETTAEGVETLDQLELVNDLGATHVQGFVYSHALDSAHVSEKLAQGVWAMAPAGPARQRADRRAMYRKSGVILGAHYHPVIIRSLSESGVFVEKMVEVPLGTELIFDLGDGQLELATVRRKNGAGYGLEFGASLVPDPHGNLTTRQRLSPYVLASSGLKGLADKGLGGQVAQAATDAVTYASKLGLDLSAPATKGADAGAAHHRVQAMFVATNPLQNLTLLKSGSATHRQLTAEEWERLKKAAEESSNPQLKNIIAFIVLTGCRFQEILSARWQDVDVAAKRWSIPATSASPERRIRLRDEVIAMLEALPRVETCKYIIFNPRTKKPYQSVFGSWDTARKRAGLANVSIHDLRKSLTSDY